VRPHPHYKDHLFAVNDILFVHPKYRNTNLSAGLFQYAEKKLKERGVSVMAIHMKVDNPFESFAEKLGFEKAEYTYQKFIGER
jgi:GNAT superfamily N-acetyltransferase